MSPSEDNHLPKLLQETHALQDAGVRSRKHKKGLCTHYSDIYLKVNLNVPQLQKLIYNMITLYIWKYEAVELNTAMIEVFSNKLSEFSIGKCDTAWNDFGFPAWEDARGQINLKYDATIMLPRSFIFLRMEMKPV